ncbi:MAG: hypothetical protein HY287_18025 [Planctomycetes bacterium]|nr:hypothetical protein [Planctomycetota bacterium]MBI3836222.1 hypothetical protein [Planctomycetota bacterium]
MVSALIMLIGIASPAVGPTSNLSYVRTVTTGVTYPARIATGPSGGSYVTDPTAMTVATFDANGVLVTTTAISQGPVGIARHTDGRVFISRLDGKIGVYTSALAAQGTVDPAPLTLTGPNDLAFDSANAELYSVDSGAHRVLVFRESAGAWILNRSWGMEGVGLGQFSSPQAIALDPILHRVLVTDADNFRVQVFDTTGILLFKFGYRILFTSDTDLAWFARGEGLAVDSCGNIYVSDALMGTVRVFSSGGSELGTTHAPVINYGTGVGQLRSPCGMMIDAGGKLYIANTNNNSIEVYSVACTTTSSEPETPAPSHVRTAKNPGRSEAARTVDAALIHRPHADSPIDIIEAMHSGEYDANLDLNSDGRIDEVDVELAVEQFGVGTIDDFKQMAGFSTVADHPPFNPPHILSLPNACGRCHSMDGAPGGMLVSSGQENLCQSCHSAGKIAGSAWVGPGNDANSHPWGIAADFGVSNGPAPGSILALHLDNGNVRCGTCHDPHEGSSAGLCAGGLCQGGPFNGSICTNAAQCAPKVNYMREEIYGAEDLLTSQGGTPVVYATRRMTVMDPTLCGECHTDIVEEWKIVGHADTHADPWSHYDWSMGNNWLCTGPGTPYSYCTGERAGNATSPATALCTGPATPLACCTGAGTGTCTIANASCTGLQTPWPCCTGTGTGNCSNTLPAAECTGAGTPEPCCTGAGAGSCSSREDCRQCHSGDGYIDYSKDFSDGTVLTRTHRGDLRVIDCLVCHSTHGTASSGKLLRIYDTVRLPTGQTYTGVGAGATCMACHNGRSVPPTNPSSVSTPHYLNGGAMLEGINAVTTFPNGPGAITYTLSNSNHTTNAGINCTVCHMAPGPSSGPEFRKVGDHTFRLVDHDTGFENVANSCATTACHPGLTTINRTANGDYDGDGVIEGIQDETNGLFNLLKDSLYDAGASRVLLNATTNVPGMEASICTAAGVPLACCTGLHTGPTCADPDAIPSYPYWTLRRCSGGTRNALPCQGTGAGTTPFDCPGGGACNATVAAGNRTSTIVNAVFNWEFVDNSGDRGVKNTGYAIGLLQIAYKGVTGNPVPNAAYRYSPAP